MSCDSICQEYAARAQMMGPPYGGAGDEAFYMAHPDLLPFDNGEGIFTFGENRDVEMGEFLRYGRNLLAERGQGTRDEETQGRAAAEKLAQVLATKPRAFARQYILHVLDGEVARHFMRRGGKAFFEPDLPRSYAASGFRYPYYSNEPANACKEYNSFSVDEAGNVKARVASFNGGFGCIIQDIFHNLHDQSDAAAESFSYGFRLFCDLQRAPDVRSPFDDTKRLANPDPHCDDAAFGSGTKGLMNIAPFVRLGNVIQRAMNAEADRDKAFGLLVLYEYLDATFGGRADF